MRCPKRNEEKPKGKIAWRKVLDGCGVNYMMGDNFLTLNHVYTLIFT